MKEIIFDRIEESRSLLLQMADEIFDTPECAGNEYRAATILTDYLAGNGFAVELGIAGLPTAFRASYSSGSGTGVRIGLLCEYDAIEGLGHGCAHHLQGPACAGAAVALKERLVGENYSLIVYGTPAEETFGGKINMLDQGYLQDIDIALMMHGGPDTCTDVKCLALSTFDVTFHGTEAHAAIMPHAGRSALDALLLSFNGIEFLREHVTDDVRMHFTVKELPGPSNVVPARAVGEFSLRAFSRKNLDTVTERFHDIIRGAALMSGVTFEIAEHPAFDSKIPCLRLNDLLMENARLAGAEGIAPPRERTGSTDFGNVLHRLPGSCLRVKFVPSGTSSHSAQYLLAGKSKQAHDAVLCAAKALAGTAWDIISSPVLAAEIAEEFARNKELYE